MIDTHAHLNFPDFDKDLEQVIGESFKNGVEKIIIPGSDVLNSKKAVEIAGEHENIFAAVGIHPHYTDEDFSKLIELAKNKKVVAIGECGLDYFRLEGDITGNQKAQKELFSKHLELAQKTDLPLIFHNRESDGDFLEMVKGQNVRGVVHCFTADWSFAREALDLGFLISFTGIITFDKTGKLEEVIKNIPLAKIMVETDSPLLAPVPYRGQRAEPWMVREIIQKIADIKGVLPEEAEEMTTTTAKNFFGI